MTLPLADSRALADLHPAFRPLAQRLIDDAVHAGVPVLVTFTLRSMATQDMLFSLGRTLFVHPVTGKRFKRGEHVTNARGGYSFHNFGLAIDLLPTELSKLPRWGDTPAHQALANSLWSQLGAVGKGIGLRWGGDFRTILDRPHFEWSGNPPLSLEQLRDGHRP